MTEILNLMGIDLSLDQVFQIMITFKEKFLAEIITSGDKILSENYFQHADHFTRILSEQENLKRSRYSADSNDEKKHSEKKDMDDKDNKIQNSDEKVVNNKDETMSKVAAVE